MTFENFNNLRTDIALDTRKAQAAQDGNAVRALSIVRDSLENMPVPENLKNIKPLWDAARASAKEGFDIRRASPALDAISKGDVNPNTFLQNYVISQTVSPKQLEVMVSTVGNNPAALETLRAGTINYLRAKAIGETADFNQAQYNKALKALGPKLDVIFDKPDADALRAVGETAANAYWRPKSDTFVNASNTEVARRAKMAGSAAAAAIDKLTHTPIGSWGQAAVEKAVSKGQQARTLKELTSPTAGAFSEAKPSIIKKIPKYTGALGTSLGAIGAAQQVK